MLNAFSDLEVEAFSEGSYRFKLNLDGTRVISILAQVGERDLITKVEIENSHSRFFEEKLIQSLSSTFNKAVGKFNISQFEKLLR